MQPEKVALEQPTQVEKRTLYLEKLGTTGKWYLPSEVEIAEPRQLGVERGFY